MNQTLLNGISTILVQAILTVLGLAVTYLITVAVSYLNKKKQAEVIKIGADGYNANATIAKGVAYQVEQLFNFVPGAGTLKATMFDKLLLAKIPGLTQDELDHFRESIVGEFNAQLATTQLLAPAYDPLKDEANVVNDAAITPENTGTFTDGKADPLVEGVNLNTEAAPIDQANATDSSTVAQ